MGSGSYPVTAEGGLQNLNLPGHDGEIYTCLVESREVILSYPPEYAIQVARSVLCLFKDEVQLVVGTSEAAVILGVTTPRVNQLRDERMITPVQTLRATPLWLTADVIACAVTRQKRPSHHSRQNQPDK